MKLPDGWKKVKLKQLAHIDKKSLGSKTSRNYVFRYISLSDVDHGHIKHNLPVIKFSDSPSRARRVVSKGDVLFSTVRPNLEGYCRITESANKLIASTGFAVITPKTNTGTEYIYQYLYSHNIKRQIYALVVGSNYPAVNSSDVSNLKFIIPDDPAERKAIADLLFTWDKAIEKTERLIQAKEKRFYALLSKLISDNGQLTTGKNDWKKVKLEAVCNVITSNVNKKTFNNEILVRLCNYMDVYKNFYITSELDFMEASATTSERTKRPSGGLKKQRERLYSLTLKGF
jgi:type I restriction enzyme, S subunit